MEYILLFFGILSQSLAGIFQKKILNKKIISAPTIVFLQQTLSGIFVLLLLPFWFLFYKQGNAEVFWISVGIASLVNVGIQYVNAKALELADISLTAPISATTPGMVVLVAISVGEIPSTLGVIGIIIISIGTYIHLRIGAKSLKEFFDPFFAFKLPRDFEKLDPEKQQEARNNKKAVFLSLIGAVLGTIGLISDGLMARNGNIALGFTVECFVVASFFSFRKKRLVRLKQDGTQTEKQFFWLDWLMRFMDY